MMSSQAIACETFGLWKNCGGAYTHALGDKYKGEFANGRPNGFGEIEFGKDKTRIGDTYRGSFVDGMLHGEGVYFFRNGDRFEGEWVLCRHGKANYLQPKVVTSRLLNMDWFQMLL